MRVLKNSCVSRATISRINRYRMRIWRMRCLFIIPWPSEPQTTANGRTSFTSGPLTGGSTSFRPREWTYYTTIFIWCHWAFHRLPFDLLSARDSTIHSPSNQFHSDKIKSHFMMFEISILLNMEIHREILLLFFSIF